MPNTNVNLTTPAGICPTEIFTPEGTGPWPSVIFCFDAFGPRAAMSQMATRIAQSGYVVALPDLYYRVGSFLDLLPPGAPRTHEAARSILTSPETRKQWMEHYYSSATSYDNLRDDIGALLDELAKRKDVRSGVGVTGYCMGGNIAMRIATIFGERIAAAASFHGGHLVRRASDSPHLRLGQIRARVYVAGAIEDGSFTDDMKQQLISALQAAHVENTVETYPGKHGFAVSDNPSFDTACAERHYAALQNLLGATLK